MGRKEDILDATLHLFEGGGLDAVTIRAISDASGASTGSIYHHFGGRSRILLALYRDCFETGVFPAILAALADARDPETGIRAAVRAYVHWVRTDPLRARFVYAASDSPALRPHTDVVARIKAGFLGEVATWMAPHLAAGTLRPLPPWAWDPVLFGAVHEVCRRWLAGAPIPLDEAVTVLEDVAWRAVCP